MHTVNYARMPGLYETPSGLSGRSPSLAGWDGPNSRIEVPCHECDGSGIIEDGEQIDVDDFRDCLCGNCEGTGQEPWRAAGDRDTSNPSRDGLIYPRRGHWSTTQKRIRSLQGRPLARLRMIEAAIRCDVACRDAVQAWKAAA